MNKSNVIELEGRDKTATLLDTQDTERTEVGAKTNCHSPN